VIPRLRSATRRRYYRGLPISWKRFLLLPLLALGACNGIVANDLVAPQNLDSPVRGQDAPAEVLEEHHVSEQLRFNVGPPSASLSVWIVDPIRLPVSIYIDSDAHDEPKVRLVYAPQTRPSTQPLAMRSAPVPRGTIFLLHGLGDSKEYFPYEFYSFILAGQGYRVILVDSRGHGRSTGDYLTYGARESRDLVQVLDDLQGQGLIIGNVGVLGISYGASTAICWAAIDPRVRAVVALEPFSSLRDATVDAGPILLGSTSWMFSENDLQKIATRVGKLGGFDVDRDSPLAAIAHCTTPILLIHGKADNFLRPAHSIRLHQADPDHSKLILVDGASHLDLWFKAVEMITRESNRWFEQYLPTRQSPTTRPATTARN
jgi:pimeloyl-ACP methyl ester carboxylesterase